MSINQAHADILNPPKIATVRQFADTTEKAFLLGVLVRAGVFSADGSQVSVTCKQLSPAVWSHLSQLFDPKNSKDTLEIRDKNVLADLEAINMKKIDVVSRGRPALFQGFENIDSNLAPALLAGMLTGGRPIRKYTVSGAPLFFIDQSPRLGKAALQAIAIRFNSLAQRKKPLVVSKRSNGGYRLSLTDMRSVAILEQTLAKGVPDRFNLRSIIEGKREKEYTPTAQNILSAHADLTGWFTGQAILPAESPKDLALVAAMVTDYPGITEGGLAFELQSMGEPNYKKRLSFALRSLTQLGILERQRAPVLPRQKIDKRTSYVFKRSAPSLDPAAFSEDGSIGRLVAEARTEAQSKVEERAAATIPVQTPDSPHAALVKKVANSMQQILSATGKKVNVLSLDPGGPGSSLQVNRYFHALQLTPGNKKERCDIIFYTPETQTMHAVEVYITSNQWTDTRNKQLFNGMLKPIVDHMDGRVPNKVFPVRSLKCITVYEDEAAEGKAINTRELANGSHTTNLARLQDMSLGAFFKEVKTQPAPDLNRYKRTQETNSPRPSRRRI